MRVEVLARNDNKVKLFCVSIYGEVLARKNS
jgi:hypothetical protein